MKNKLLLFALILFGFQCTFKFNVYEDQRKKDEPKEGVNQLTEINPNIRAPQANIRPDQQTTKTAEATDAIYTQETGVLQKITFAEARKYFTPDIEAEWNAYVPDTTGNTTDLMRFAKDSAGAVWYIAADSSAVKLYDPNQSQTISKAGNTVTLSNGGGSFTDATNDSDADPTNELQSPSAIRDSLALLTGSNRLDTSAIKNLTITSDQIVNSTITHNDLSISPVDGLTKNDTIRIYTSNGVEVFRDTIGQGIAPIDYIDGLGNASGNIAMPTDSILTVDDIISSSGEVQVLDEFYVNDPDFTNGWMRFDARANNSPRITLQSAEFYRDGSGGIVFGESGKTNRVLGKFQIESLTSTSAELIFKGNSGTQGININGSWGNDIPFNFYNSGAGSAKHNFQGRVRIGDGLYGASNTYDAPENGLRVEGNTQLDSLLILSNYQNDSVTYTGLGKTWSGDLLSLSTDGYTVPLNHSSIFNSVATRDSLTTRDGTVGELVFVRDIAAYYEYKADSLAGYANTGRGVMSNGTGYYHYYPVNGVNPRHFDAIGDNSNDDTEEINDAFAYADYADIFHVNFSRDGDDIFLVSDTIFIAQNQRGVPSEEVYLIQGNGNRLSTVTEDIPIFYSMPDVIQDNDMRRIHIDNFYFHGNNTDGTKALMLGATYHAKITNSYFYRLDTAIIMPFTLLGTLQSCRFGQNNGEDVQFITGDEFEQISGYPSASGAATATNSVDVIDCRFFGDVDATANLRISGADGCTVKDSYFEGGTADYAIILKANLSVNNGNSIEHCAVEHAVPASDTAVAILLDNPKSVVIDDFQMSALDTFLQVINGSTNEHVKIINPKIFNNNPILIDNGGSATGTFFDIVDYEVSTIPNKWTEASSYAGGVMPFVSVEYKRSQNTGQKYIWNNKDVLMQSNEGSIILETDFGSGRVISLRDSTDALDIQTQGIDLNNTTILGSGYGAGDQEASDLSKTRSTYFIEAATDGTLMDVQLIVVGSAAPSTTPTFVGQIFIDTTNDNVYIAKGTASSADWVQVNN